MLTDIPIERVKICNKIIQYAKDTLQKNINDNIYVSLTDHINFAIERVEMGVPFQNPSVQLLYDSCPLKLQCYYLQFL